MPRSELDSAQVVEAAARLVLPHFPILGREEHRA